MAIFIEPDVTKYPGDFDAIKCPGLEALTGADMCISSLPIPPTTNLQLHINCHSLFVQIKIGYDICSFDQLKMSIARMQIQKIPKGQAILLPIGEYKEDDNGLLRVKGQKPFGTTAFSTLDTIFDMWRMRGGSVHCDPTTPKSIDDLQAWIDRKQTSLDKITKEGKRDVYPPRPVFEPDDIWQAVEEIDDWRRLLVCGIEGLGSKTVNNIFAYADEHIPSKKFGLYHILCLMTDEDDKGKPVHKIPLWGTGKRKDLRGTLGLKDGWNMPEMAYELAFWNGWEAFGQNFLRLVEKGKSPKEAHKQLMGQRKHIVENEIPF